jgi:subtilisin family serine protease
MLVVSTQGGEMMVRAQKSFFGLAVLVLALAGCGSSSTGVGPGALCTTKAAAMSVIENEVPSSVDAENVSYIVKLRDSAHSLNQLKSDSMSSVANDHELTVSPINKHLTSIRVKRGSSRAVLSKYIEQNDIEFIEPDYDTFAIQNSNDPYIAKQWAHDVIHSYEAWDITRGSSDVVVGVIDTGIDYTHTDLAPNMWTNPKETVNGVDDDGNGLIDDIYGWDFVNNDNQPMADDTGSFHGTHVAGTIGAVGNNGIGVSGHAPNVKLMALKYLNSSGSGKTSDAIRAIDYSITKGVKILSNSWGSTSPSAALSSAIERARGAGILFVAAAGNGGSDGIGDNVDSSPFYPASLGNDNILSVAATDSSDHLASWSNFGLRGVDVAAPGVNIYSTLNGNSYGNKSGTSMATPLVSGVAALVASVRPDFNYKDIKNVILASVDRISGLTGKVSSAGRVNAYKAVAMAQSVIGHPATPDPVIPDGEDSCRPN